MDKLKTRMYYCKTSGAVTSFMVTTTAGGPVVYNCRECSKPYFAPPSTLFSPVDRATCNVAKTFSCLIGAHLGLDTLKEVIKRNGTEESPDVCHTHDFCDANEYMNRAMILHGYGDVDFINREQADVWDRAWRMASYLDFSPRAINTVSPQA